MPIGLLSNGSELRLVYAPIDSASGYISFRVADMLQSDGRAILLDAFLMLLEARTPTRSCSARSLHTTARPRRLQRWLLSPRVHYDGSPATICTSAIRILEPSGRSTSTSRHGRLAASTLREPLGSVKARLHGWPLPCGRSETRSRE